MIGPIAVLGVAALVTMLAWLSAQGLTPVRQPADLRRGAVNEAEFWVRRGGLYAVGVEMDREQATRLFPCMVDAMAPSFGLCTPARFPLNLKLEVQGLRDETPLHISPDTSLAGGVFSASSFTRPIAFVRLEAGKRYRVTAVSQVDGRPLSATSPQLIVAMDGISRKDIELSGMLIAILAGLVGIAAAVWGVVVGSRLKAGS